MTHPPVVLRIRASWAGEHTGYRYQIGVPGSKAEASRMEGLKKVLYRVARRGDWNVLIAVKDGRLTPEAVAAAVDEFGMGDFKSQLPALDEPAPDPTRQPTLDEHVEAWIAAQEGTDDLRDSTMDIYTRSLKKLREFVDGEGKRLGDRLWYRVPRHTIRDVKASLNLAPGTLRSILGAWGSFYTWAIDREESLAEHEGRDPVLVESPVRRAEAWGTIETTRHRFLTPEEFARLIEVAPAPMRGQYATLTLAGLRIDEFMVLPPAHVRLPNVIHVGPWGGWRPKVARSIRDIPIRPDLLPFLEEYRAEWAGTGDAFFVNPNTGRGWRYTAFTNRMKKDIEAAGMIYGAHTWDDEDELDRIAEGITPHTLRHTFGSWMAQRDVQLVKIARLMGDTRETVEKHYLHLFPTDLEEAVNRMELPNLRPTN